MTWNVVNLEATIDSQITIEINLPNLISPHHVNFWAELEARSLIFVKACRLNMFGCPDHAIHTRLRTPHLAKWLYINTFFVGLISIVLWSCLVVVWPWFAIKPAFITSLLLCAVYRYYVACMPMKRCARLDSVRTPLRIKGDVRPSPHNHIVYNIMTCWEMILMCIDYNRNVRCV